MQCKIEIQSKILFKASISQHPVGKIKLLLITYHKSVSNACFSAQETRPC